ncbi:hypothetical protein [Sphingobacterium sp. MYb388]
MATANITHPSYSFQSSLTLNCHQTIKWSWQSPRPYIDLNNRDPKDKMKEEYGKYLPICGVTAPNRPTHKPITFEFEKL